MIRSAAHRLGRALARRLNRPRGRYERFAVTPIDRLERVLRPGDVLLVEGNSRLSRVIQYLTQSTWSHAALYVGSAARCEGVPTDHVLVEADVEHGVVAVPLSKYAERNTRICRPVGLRDADRRALVDRVCSQIGHRYDLRNIFDLARYFLPLVPVPARWRRHVLAMGSGDPTRAICSSMIAEAFQSIGYPILPRRTEYAHVDENETRILQRRHYTHFVPRDFDLSPYFRVVKPTLVLGFDYRDVVWREPDDTDSTS